MEASVEKEVPSNLAPASVHRATVDPAARRVCVPRQGDVYPGRGYPSREGGTRVEKGVPSNLAHASVHRASVAPAVRRVCLPRGNVYPGRGYPMREGGTFKPRTCCTY